MQFLAPLFLAALAGLAIPIVLHLTQREKKQVVRFPSLMFVKRIPYQSVRRRKIHNWLLLMVRLTALALIVFAFARPLFTSADAMLLPGEGGREVVILLDASYSMGFGDRWTRALEAVNAEIGNLTSADRASLVLFAANADILLRSTAERDRLVAAASTARPGAGATRYAPALKVAGSLIEESTLPRREVVMVSDFQRSGWRGEEGSRLPPGATLRTVPIEGATDRPNLSVTGVSLSRGAFSNQERVTVTAGIANRTERPVTGASVALEVNGLPVATRTIDVQGGDSASVTFEAFTLSARNMRGTVRLGDDALAIDNLFHFVVSPAEPIRVTLVTRGGESALYISRVLAVGESPRYEVTTREPGAVSDDDLRRSAVVVLNDIEVPAALGRRLARFVEGGGGLFVATGARASWPADVELLPGSIGAPVDRTRGTAGRVGGLELGHPVFEPFRSPRSGDFSGAQVYGYRTLTAAPEATVLARFDSGAPALLEGRAGTGRVLVWGTTLDRSWSDIPLSGIFLPFVHRSVRHLASYVEAQPWLTVGQVLDPAMVARASRTQQPHRAVLTPSARRLPIEDEGPAVLEVTEQGFYELRGEENADLAVVAVNVDPAEADLTAMDPEEIAVAATGEPGGVASGPAEGVPLTPEAQERNQRLWWFLLLAGVLLLGADTLMSNRLAARA